MADVEIANHHWPAEIVRNLANPSLSPYFGQARLYLSSYLSTDFSLRALRFGRRWIPAFAGMTKLLS
jgi:hypothetical protein